MKFIDKLIGHSAAFILFYYESYIQIDWSDTTKLGRIYYAPFNFVRTIIMWLICPIAIPEYFWLRSKMYQDFLKMRAKIEKDFIK